MLNLKMNSKMKELLSEFTQELSSAQFSGDRAREAGILNDIGNLFEMQDEDENALQCYQEALGIENRTGNREGAGIELYNIGIIYLKWGLLTEALKLFEQSLSIAEDLDQLNLIEKRLVQIERIYQLQGDTDKQLRIHREMNAITDMNLLSNQNQKNRHYQDGKNKNQIATRKNNRIY